jgi:hypothetical protein
MVSGFIGRVGWAMLAVAMLAIGAWLVPTLTGFVVLAVFVWNIYAVKEVVHDFRGALRSRGGGDNLDVLAAANNGMRVVNVHVAAGGHRLGVREHTGGSGAVRGDDSAGGGAAGLSDSDVRGEVAAAVMEARLMELAPGRLYEAVWDDDDR